MSDVVVVLALIFSRYLGFEVKPEVDWFFEFLAMLRTYGNKIGDDRSNGPRDIVIYSFSGLISRGSLGFWFKPEVDCFSGV